MPGLLGPARSRRRAAVGAPGCAPRLPSLRVARMCRMPGHVARPAGWVLRS